MSTPIIEMPASIASYSERYHSYFDNDRQFRHFQEYLTGLIVSENVTFEGINALFPHRSDPSNLNRFLTQAP